MLHRHPYATDAYELGFAPGVREDYTYRADAYPNVELPVVILDNEFRDPDLERYQDVFERYDPSVAIVGDAHTVEEARTLNEFVCELSADHPYKEYVVVPKCQDAFDIIDDEIVLGYPMGYSTVQATDIGEIRQWRDKKVHLLGGSPTQQYDVIEQLTQPTLLGDPPADIVGMDWNGMQKAAYYGEYWHPDGWRSADHLSIRETVRTSLLELKQFWQDHGIWPDTEPIDVYGPAVDEPDDPIFIDCGGQPIPDRDALEAAYIDEYDELGKVAFEQEAYKHFLEYREDLLQPETVDWL